MVPLVWLLLQAAAPAPAVTPSEFDLATVRADDPRLGLRRACLGEGDEIVVCGRRRVEEGYPIEAMQRRYARSPLVAQTGIAQGAIARAYVETREVGPGLKSNRVMVGVGLKF
jgi:hypothetical protein